MITTLIKSAHEIVEWYWKAGTNRSGVYKISTNQWLADLYRTTTQLKNLAEAEAQEKPAFAIWGPSQVGKSTLLSHFIDAKADEAGRGSALHWKGGAPMRYSPPLDPKPDFRFFNPYHGGPDATACVTRYRLGNQEINPEYPVEIRLLSTRELLHMAANGYLNQCRHELKGGKYTIVNPAQIETWLQDLPRLKPDRDAFEALVNVVDALELMVERSFEDRYKHLKSEWRTLRQTLLGHPALVGSETAVWRFAENVFWDGRQKLSDLFHRLRHLPSAWSAKKIFCSLPAAAALVDMQLYGKAVAAGADDRSLKAAAAVLALSKQAIGHTIYLGEEAGTSRAFATLGDFADFQAITAELVVPLNPANLEGNAAPLKKLLEQCDLLDLPGVAREDQAAEELRIDLDQLQSSDAPLLYLVMKRGKTSGIVMGYAQSQRIDGWSILVKTKDYPSKPAQIVKGLEAWWDYMASGSLVGRSPLPVNLVLTYFNKTVQDCFQNASWNDPFIQLENLGKVSNPEIIHHTLVVSSPKYPEGQIVHPDPLVKNRLEARDKAAEMIKTHPAFTSRFKSAEGLKSFEKMLENSEFGQDGGCSFLFSVMEKQAEEISGVHREKRLAENRRALFLRLLELANAVRPPREHGQIAARKADLTQWKENLRLLYCGFKDVGALVDMSSKLRRLVDVEAELLEPLPFTANGQTNAAQAETYVMNQISRWLQARISVVGNDSFARAIGFLNAEHARNCLGCLADSVDCAGIARWLIAEFSEECTIAAAKISRRYLAVKLSDSFLRRIEPNAHPELTSVETMLERAAPEDGSFSLQNQPHFYAVISPMCLTLASLIAAPPKSSRPEFPGDNEIEQRWINLSALQSQFAP